MENIVVGRWAPNNLRFLILVEAVLVRKLFNGNHIIWIEPLWSWRARRALKEQVITNALIFAPVSVLVGWL